MENAISDEESGSGDSVVLVGTPGAQRRRNSRSKRKKDKRMYNIRYVLLQKHTMHVQEMTLVTYQVLLHL